jgi:hypothetical protein
MEKINLVAELHESGYEVLLAATYTLDLETFEKLILRKLLYNGCSYIGIYADQNRLIEEVSQAEGIQSLGRNYALKGVIGKNAFHPKIYLLLGRKKAKLLVGSGNFTAAGMINNLEVFEKFSYSEGDPENLSIIQEAFQQFMGYSEKSASDSFKEIYRKAQEFDYVHFDKVKGLGEHRLYHNGEESIYGQIKGRLPDNLQEIHIFTPYFDSKLKVIDAMKKDFPAAKIHIYLQESTSNFPVEMISSMKDDLFKVVYKVNEKKNYHGKMNFFVGNHNEYILYGSPNCSGIAMLESGNKSNQEVALLKDVEKGYFDRWKDKQINTEKITDTIDVLPVDQSSPWVTQPIDYLDGVLKNHCLRVFLKGKGIEEVNLGERKGRIVLEADLYTVEWPDLAEQLPGIFKLNVKADGQSYEIDGWYHWYEELMRNQARVRESVYERLESDPNLETYENVVDLFNDLMERLILDEKDLDNAKEQGVTKESRMHDQSELRDSESIEISDNIDDYYVEDDEEEKPYGSIGGVDVLKELIHKLLGYMDDAETLDSALTKELKPVISSYQKKIVEENYKTIEYIQKRVNRFTYKFEKGILSQRYLQRVKPEIFLTNIKLYVGLLGKLTDNEHIIYLPEDMVALWLKLIDVFSSYTKTHALSEEDLRGFIIPNMLAALYVKDKSISEYEDLPKMKYERKEITNRLEGIHRQLMPIRRDYLKHHRLVKNALSKMGKPKCDKEDLEEFMESIFTFKTYEGFRDELKKRYDIVSLSKEKGEVILTFPMKGFNFDFWIKILMILKDLIGLEELKDVDKLTITINNEVQNDPKKQFQLIYFRKKKTLQKQIMYKNGTKLVEEKSRVEERQIIYAEDRGKESFLTLGFSLIR